MFVVHFSYCSSLIKAFATHGRGIPLVDQGRPHCASKRSCQLCLVRCHDPNLWKCMARTIQMESKVMELTEIYERIGVSLQEGSKKWVQSTRARLGRCFLTVHSLTLLSMEPLLQQFQFTVCVAFGLEILLGKGCKGCPQQK